MFIFVPTRNMNSYTRLLNFGTVKCSSKVNLIITGPHYTSKNEMYYEWSCDLIHPCASKIFGIDEIWCLYYTLNSIELFFKGMCEQNFHIWLNEFGDNAGFQYGKHKIEE